jgi:hypothetical protein
MMAESAKAEHAFAVQDRITTAANNRLSTIAQARALLAKVQRARDLVAPIKKIIMAEKAIQQAFKEIVRARGGLTFHRNTTESERAMHRGAATLPVRVGIIKGIDAAADNQLDSDLLYRVIEPLENWKPEEQKGKSIRQLEEQIRSINALGDILQRAELFVEHAERFVHPANWTMFESYCVQSGLNARLDLRTRNDIRELAGLHRRQY